jgi:hypothetical protein
MPGRRPRHIRKSARNDAQCGDLKKRPSPQRDLAKSLFLSSMHMRNCALRNGHKYGADVKKYPFKGGLFTSPEASRPPDRRAQSAQSVGPARSFHGDQTASCAVARAALDVRAVARAALDVRAVAAGRSAFASERPFSAPFSALSAFPTSSVFNSFLTV